MLTKPLFSVLKELETTAHIHPSTSSESLVEKKQIDDNIPSDRAKFQEILHAALRKIETLEMQLQKSRNEKLLSKWETIIHKVVVCILFESCCDLKDRTYIRNSRRNSNIMRNLDVFS